MNSPLDKVEYKNSKNYWPNKPKNDTFSLTIFQAYTLSIVHYSSHALFQPYTLTLLHSYTYTVTLLHSYTVTL